VVGADVVRTGPPDWASGCSPHATTPTTSKNAAQSRNLDIKIPLYARDVAQTPMVARG